MRSGGKIPLTPIIPVLLYHGPAGGVAEHRLSAEEYQALSRYLFETGELPANELIAKIELLVHQGRIREGLLTTAEQLRKMGFEEGEEIGIRKGEEAGRYRERTELARQMLTAGEDMQKVARYTRLTPEELQALVKDES